MIIDTLISKIKQTQNPTVVGLDPRLDYIPTHIKEACFDKHGKTPKAVADMFLAFNIALINEIHDLIPAVKPQVAMYEELGPCGMDAYISTIKHAKAKGLIIIGDVKRGDIASTAESYSNGHIGCVGIEGEEFEIYHEDFITLNPYLGQDSIEPYFANCKAYNKGMFVLVKTSNPGGGQIQDLKIEGGETIFERVGSLVETWGEGFIGEFGYSSIGAVVGATHPAQTATLRKRMPHTFFLVPGYGAQGGTAADIAPCFGKDGLGAIVNSSRGIIAAHKNPKYGFTEENFAKAARAAVIDMKEDLQTAF